MSEGRSAKGGREASGGTDKLRGSIDVHAHWVPDAYGQAIRELGRPLTSLHTPMEQDSNLESRMRWMDQHGVGMLVLTLDGGMPWAWASEADAARLARLVNDAAVAAHRKYPERFIAGIELPVRYPGAALAELNRMAGAPGMRAVHVPSSMANSDYLFQGDYDALWARCEKLGFPVLFHPLNAAESIYGGRSRLGGELELAANLNNSLGFPFDSATLAAKLIISGTLDRFPGLQIVLPHGGGCFPYLAGRIEQGLAAKKFQVGRPFREYIRRFHYDTLIFYPEALRFLIELAGADRVVIGSDSFAPMLAAEPNALAEELNLPAREREWILYGNAMRLFGLGLSRAMGGSDGGE